MIRTWRLCYLSRSSPYWKIYLTVEAENPFEAQFRATAALKKEFDLTGMAFGSIELLETIKIPPKEPA